MILFIKAYKSCRENKIQLSSFEGIIKLRQNFLNVRFSFGSEGTNRSQFFYNAQRLLERSNEDLSARTAPSLGEAWDAQGGCSAFCVYVR